MKLLLDENLPHQLRLELEGHEVVTVAYQGWCGIKNGELLALAAAGGFDALITNDRGFEHQHNISRLPVSIILLLVDSNTIEAIRHLYPELNRKLNSIQPCSLVKVGSGQ